MRRFRTLFLSCLVAASSAAMAGTADVTFVNPRSYSDAGSVAWDREATLKALGDHLQGLGQRLLPTDQVLKVQVLDVILAGTERLGRGGIPVRVTRGGADFPRIKLRYTLEVGGRPVRSGQEEVADLDYSRGMLAGRESDPLYYEKHMLDKWFRERFVEGRPASG